MNLKNVILLKVLYIYSYMYCLKTINYTDKLNDPKTNGFILDPVAYYFFSVN